MTDGTLAWVMIPNINLSERSRKALQYVQHHSAGEKVLPQATDSMVGDLLTRLVLTEEARLTLQGCARGLGCSDRARGADVGFALVVLTSRGVANCSACLEHCCQSLNPFQVKGWNNQQNEFVCHLACRFSFCLSGVVSSLVIGVSPCVLFQSFCSKRPYFAMLSLMPFIYHPWPMLGNFVDLLKTIEF